MYLRFMYTDKKITIAIDGYSSCGKSTLAKALAKRLGYIFIDSGAMYRGVALYCMRHQLIVDGIPLTDQIETALSHIKLAFIYNASTEKHDLYLNDENVEELIRMPDVASNVSPIATVKCVREKLVAEQQKMGEFGGIVMDGRDIGSVVFPNAELKLFVTASPEIRAERRFKELTQKGVSANFKTVLANLVERDLIDSTRTESPLIQTKDAIFIDTSHLTPTEQLQLTLTFVDQVLENCKDKSNC